MTAENLRERLSGIGIITLRRKSASKERTIYKMLERVTFLRFVIPEIAIMTNNMRQQP